jgi:hypothetical protein
MSDSEKLTFPCEDCTLNKYLQGRNIGSIGFLPDGYPGITSEGFQYYTRFPTIFPKIEKETCDGGMTYAKFFQEKYPDIVARMEICHGPIIKEVDAGRVKNKVVLFLTKLGLIKNLSIEECSVIDETLAENIALETVARTHYGKKVKYRK